TEVDENGRYSGYTYDYLQEIAQFTGWDYEFVQVPGNDDESISTLMEMLEAGEIDLMGGMLYQESMAQRYDYDGYSYGTVNTVLQVLIEDEIAAFDPQELQHMRVAILGSSTVRRQKLLDFCEKNRITPELVPCENKEEQVRALKEGRADALLNTSANPIEGVRTLVKF
ncbi:transporter substrate-binding domain-containing protein, partial [Methanomethylophilus alvi]|uniref:transporter substrate-binding domain-containing protein n=1 Tax=Methanomethylophilus alvi TaxID=1291540 RepID=UPI0037DDDC87